MSAETRYFPVGFSRGKKLVAWILKLMARILKSEPLIFSLLPCGYNALKISFHFSAPENAVYRLGFASPHVRFRAALCAFCVALCSSRCGAKGRGGVRRVVRRVTCGMAFPAVRWRDGRLIRRISLCTRPYAACPRCRRYRIPSTLRPIARAV